MKVPQLDLSRLLLMPPNTNHQPLVMEFLKQLDPDLTQDNPRLYWFNQEKTSLKIATIREIITKTAYSSYQNQLNYYVLLHADLATLPAQHALLKLLEEPPTNISLILTATSQEKLLATIRSRCLVGFSELTKSRPQSSTVDEDLFNQLEQFLYNPKRTSYSELINSLEKCKERDQTISLLIELIQDFRPQKSYNKRHSISPEFRVFVTQQLLKTYRLITQNVNIRLALENCFFKIKRQFENSAEL